MRSGNTPTGGHLPKDRADTLSARTHTSGALRLTGACDEWQVSWGFQGIPVDWQRRAQAPGGSPKGELSPDLLTWPM